MQEKINETVPLVADVASSQESNGKTVKIVAEYIEKHKAKIEITIKENVGPMSLAVLNNDETMRKLGSVIYNLLPSVVRFALKEEVFMEVFLSKRTLLLARFVG